MTQFSWNELLEILKKEQPSIVLRQMQEQGELVGILPEISRLDGVIQPESHHPEGHAFEHTMQVLDEMRKLTDEPKYLMAALCHDVGKGITPPELLPKHHNHEKNGIPISKAICERLLVPEDVMEATIVGTENHGKFHRIMEMRAVRLVDFLNAMADTSLGIKGLAYLGLCDHRGRNNPNGSHECLEAWFKMYDHIQSHPAFPGERKEDTRMRHAKEIAKLQKDY